MPRRSATKKASGDWARLACRRSGHSGPRGGPPLTHIEALELDYLPSHLIVLGGGYVGIESAQKFRRFGSRVTIIELGRQPMGREDLARLPYPKLRDAVFSHLTMAEGLGPLFASIPARSA